MNNLSLVDDKINIHELSENRPFERLFHNATARILDFLIVFREFDYSEADIARKTGLTPKTVSKELNSLLNENIIKITRKNGRSNMYMIGDSKDAQKMIEYVDQKIENNMKTYRKSSIN